MPAWQAESLRYLRLLPDLAALADVVLCWKAAWQPERLRYR